MNIKELMKRGIKYIVKGVPIIKVNVNITQVQYGHILQGKNIIVTGGSRGLGFYIAKKYINEGAKVIITGTNETNLRNAKDKLGKNCDYIVLNQLDVEKFDSFFEECRKIFKSNNIDGIVCNAGISLHEGSIYNVTTDGFDNQFNINLKGHYFFAQSYLKYFDKFQLDNGNIIFISSERGLYADDIPYGLTKTAINSLTRGLGQRVLNRNIRVNAIAPGVTATEMTGINKTDNLYNKNVIGKRSFLPEEIAEIAMFLMSDASKSICSEIIACGQGNHLRPIY